MKKAISIVIFVSVVLAIFLFFYTAAKVKLIICLPSFDTVTIPNIEAFSNWMANSIVTLSLFYNFFQWLQKKAILSEDTIDNRVLTYLTNFFSMNWFKSITNKSKKQ